MNQALKNFKQHLDQADENSTAIFLGDNIYPAGFPSPKKEKEHKLAQNHLDAQLKTLEDFKGQPIFIPGNHDWYSDGPKGVKRQQDYIEEALDSKKVFQPRNGRPIEKINISDNIVVIVLDSEWYLTDWDKYPTMNDDPWDTALRGGLTPEDKKKHHINVRTGFVGSDTKHFYANDEENPYTEVKPFLWVRAHQMGGRSLLWGKQTYRWSEIDFEAPKTVNENGKANYTYEILSADNNSFKARATAITDFDGDGVMNVWEIDENGAPKQIVKD